MPGKYLEIDILPSTAKYKLTMKQNDLKLFKMFKSTVKKRKMSINWTGDYDIRKVDLMWILSFQICMLCTMVPASKFVDKIFNQSRPFN